MKDIMGIMKKAQEMQARMQDMQAEMENTLVEGQSGGGMVKITLTAKGVMKGVSIDPSLLKQDEKEIVEDLSSPLMKMRAEKPSRSWNPR